MRAEFTLKCVDPDLWHEKKRSNSSPDVTQGDARKGGTDQVDLEVGMSKNNSPLSASIVGVQQT